MSGFSYVSLFVASEMGQLEVLQALLALPPSHLYGAMRRWLLGRTELPFNAWLSVKTLLLARRFLDDTRIDRSALAKLASALHLSRRREWLAAFGLLPGGGLGSDDGGAPSEVLRLRRLWG